MERVRGRRRQMVVNEQEMTDVEIASVTNTSSAHHAPLSEVASTDESIADIKSSDDLESQPPAEE